MWNEILVFLSGFSVFWIAATLGCMYFVPSAVMAFAAPRALPRPTPPASRERRRVRRFAAEGEVVLSWQTDREGAESVRASLLDLGELGATAKSPLGLNPGTYVYLEIPYLRSATTANVRHSTVRGRHHLIGLEFRGPLFPK
jgi:hypothetical protein